MMSQPAGAEPSVVRTPIVVPRRRGTAALLLIAGVGVLSTVFGALPAPLVAVLSAIWCVTVAWFSLSGTSTVGFTVIASVVKVSTLFLIVWAIVDPASPVGIRSGLYWVPLGLLNMATGLWFLRVIRHRTQ